MATCPTPQASVKLHGPLQVILRARIRIIIIIDHAGILVGSCHLIYAEPPCNNSRVNQSLAVSNAIPAFVAMNEIACGR